MPLPGSHDALEAALAPVRRRMRVGRVLHALPWAIGSAALACAAIAIVRWVKLDPAALVYRTWALGLAACAALLPALRRASVVDAARLADTAHDLDSRLLNAVHLMGRANRDDFENAAIDDAMKRLPVDPKRAVPLTLRRALGPSALALVAAFALGYLTLPRASRARPIAPHLHAVELDADTIAATRAELRPIRQQASSPDVERTLTELDTLLDELAAGRLDREEAFRRLDAITRELSDAGRNTPSSAEQSLANVGRSLGTRSRELEPLTNALREADAERAAAAMHQLSERMQAGAIDRAELQRIREAFERTATERDARQDEQSALSQRREELLRDLERQRQQNAEPSLLERRERELERLERQIQELEQQRRELERLERELEESAEDLQHSDPTEAAQDLRQAFEDLNRMARERTTQEQREALQRQIEQLREALRRQREESGGEQSGGRGQSGGSAMRRFVLRAGGGEGGGQRVTIRMPGEGEPGGESPGGEGEGEGQGGSPGAPPGGGQPGSGQGEGQGQGTGQNPSGDLVLDMRPGGAGTRAILEMPGGGGEGERGSSPGGDPGGEGAGTDHHPDSLDAASDLDSSGALSNVDGTEGDGATRSQVIRGASASGFAGRSYRNVHADYTDHAEEILEREDVPPGYRYYVRRYFQLIRPREGSTP